MIALKNSKVVVTGGAGFIGSHLVRELISMGAKEVVIIDSLRYGKTANLDSLESDPRVRCVQFDLASDSFAPVESAVVGANYLFHLAAEKHNQSKDSPDRVIAANITGTLKLFEIAAKAGVKKIVFTSSLYSYGRSSDIPFEEKDLLRADTVYGMSKIAGERLLDYARKMYSIEGVSVRYFFIYGPRQFAGMGYKSVILKNFEKLLNGQPPTIFGDGNQALDYVFVEDAVAATILAMEKGQDGRIYNIASGVATKINDLVRDMQQVAGTNFLPEFGPADFTHGTTRSGNSNLAKSELGWNAKTTLKDGLAKTYHWLRNGL